MGSVTKSIQSLVVPKSGVIMEYVIKKQKQNWIYQQYNAILQKLRQECEKAISDMCEEEWYCIENKPFYYYKTAKYYYLLPDVNRKALPEMIRNYSQLYSFLEFNSINEFIMNLEPMEGISMRWMGPEDLMLFRADIRNPVRRRLVNFIEQIPRIEGITYLDEQGFRRACDVINSEYNWDGWGVLYPIHKTGRQDMKELDFLLQNGLIPMGISSGSKKAFQLLIDLLRENKVVYDGAELVLSPYMKGLLDQGRREQFGRFKISENAEFPDMENGVLRIGRRLTDRLVELFMECDRVRADLEPYDPGQVTELNRGHWELWQEKETESMLRADDVKLQTAYPLVARNPVADINRKGTVGIDFGTKCTVAVLLDDHSRMHPLRIGSGNLRKRERRSDYENPTVMEFRDMQAFLQSYGEIEGRPSTRWEDLTISHTAAYDLQNAQSSRNFYAFFSDLKQWTDTSSCGLRIKDLKQHEMVLQGFLNLDEQSMNPVEIYAYYIGLAINNMRNGIYLDYVLSYPVNYPQKVREKILKSFESGLKKSLPEQVLKDKKSMEQFRVIAGVSEPAAYAISALKGYGFTPEEGETYFYGIFDFGGGTTDFDFGIWRGAAGSECRRYDYVIEHFGAGGDRYLGGENLLALLAFDVFQANRDTMLELGLTFSMPAERNRFSGSEVLVSSSQEAKLNTRQLMEKLRCLWEHGGLLEAAGQKDSAGPRLDERTAGKAESGKELDPEIENGMRAIREGSIKVSLFDEKGNILPNVELNVDGKELMTTLTERIRSGVRNFFEAMKTSMLQQELEDLDRIHIFLAGNSSKSPIVSRVFQEMAQELSSDAGGFWKTADADGEGLFVIYPPLGTQEAEDRKREMGYSDPDNRPEYEKPTGKTGVAYGLLEGRRGSRIKVISEQEQSEETKFKFYLGYEKRGKFHVELDRELPYGEWKEFIDAGETDFELFFTSLPEAVTNQMDITRVGRMPCRIQKAYEDEEIRIYLRAAEPDVVEYVAAKEGELEKEQYAEGPYRIKLEE